jgi:4-amino-4-deoxy-L-arabinose transferase-like glycosyltransferase
MLQLKDLPLIQPEGGVDSAAYVRLAREVLSGNMWLGPGLYFMSPLYLYFLAAAFGATGSFDAVRVIQVLLGTAAVWFVFKTAEQWFGRRAAWIAAALMALTGPFTFYELLILQASLDAFLTAGGLYFLTLGLNRHEEISNEIFRLKAEATESGFVASAFRRKIGFDPNALVAGVFLGLQVLNRPNIVIVVAGMTLIMLAIRRWRIALPFAAGAALAVSPVVARNALVSHQFALASSHGGLNFYIGNNPSATGQYEYVPGVRANIEGQAEDTRKVAEKAAGRPLTDAEVSSYFAGQALEWIRGNPGAAAKLFARKVALVFNARHQWLDFSYPYYANETGSQLWLLFVGPWFLVPVGLAGVVLGSKGSRGSMGSVLLGAFVGLCALSVAVFFVAERYRLPMFVPLCVTSAAAIERMLVDSRARVVGAVVCAAAAVVCWWPFPLNNGQYNERLIVAKVLMNRREYPQAAVEFEKALAIQPDNAVTEFNLGVAQVSSGRAADGIAHMRKAVDAGVKIDGARYALVNAMLMTGDRDGAVTLLRTYYPAEADSADSCFQVGILALNAGAPRVAERYLQRALQLRPGWPEALQALQQLR